ncbi:transglutaminase domain-containing protein [Bacteroidota bacterium]
MSKQTLLTVVMLGLVITHSLAGSWNADSLARSIPSKVTGSPEDFAQYLTNKFPEDKERVRALFSWLSSNISYDLHQVETMSRFETMDEFVIYTLKNKKAVCQGYAEIFTAVCNGMGIPALTVHGYNRIDGQLKTELGHAWNVAKIDGKWYLFDPTWGSGYVDNGRYRKSFDAFFFMASPDSLVETHMPFDPVWQLREYPITHDQFIEGGNHGSIYYNYTDSLNRYYILDEVGRAESTLQRAEATQANRREIQKMYRRYNSYVNNIKCNIEITRYNESSTTLKDAIDRFNEFQVSRSKRNPSKSQLKSLLDRARLAVQQSLLQARQISSCQSLSAQEVRRLIKQIDEVSEAVSQALRSL